MICYFYFYFISWGQEDKDEKRQENGQNLIFVNHALVGHVLKKIITFTFGCTARARSFLL